MKSITDLVDLTGQVAVVTGAGKGIGRAIALRLAEAGAETVVADIDYPAASDTARIIVTNEWQALAWKLDVAAEAEVSELVREVEDEMGALDIVVNNAGIYPAVPVEELSEELFDRVVQVNLRSVFLMTKYAAEVMQRHGGGRIINITSIDAVRPSMVGLAHYDATKHGVWGFTKNAALEYAKDNILINAIAPGGIVTPGTSGPQVSAHLAAGRDRFLEKIPLRRMGDADEIATVALFLASGMATYLTGAQIVVDGGALLT